MDNSERIAQVTENDELGRLLGVASDIQGKLDEAKTARAEGKAIAESVAELETQMAAVKADINAWQQAENERIASQRLDSLFEDVQTLMATRAPSKAAIIGGAAPSATGKPNASFLLAVKMSRSRDYQEQAEGKALLEAFGSEFAGKATLGDTNAAGGFIVPNAVLTTLIEQSTVPRSIVDLFTVINGVTGNSLQIPFENSAVTRATIVAAGVTKENQDFIVGAYTASLYTLARILDVGNQLLRQSNGAAEALVRSRLARAFGLGEDYYALNGTGSSQPYGLLTAIGTSGAYVSTFSSPSNTTLAGSLIAAVITATGALEGRGADADGVVVNTADYYLGRLQGTDNAGFWIDPFAPAPDIGQDGPGPLNLRWRHTPTMPTDSLVVGEYRSALWIRGLGYRVDVSDQAADRWDQNVTGFRAEEEIAFDARPPVYAGRFQRITNAVA
mgnify:CR=1 FL=1